MGPSGGDPEQQDPGRIDNMQVISLDLERQPVPEARFGMIVTSMVIALALDGGLHLGVGRLGSASDHAEEVDLPARIESNLVVADKAPFGAVAVR